MDQQTFNRILTISLLLYFMVLYTLSWFFSKPLDLNNALVFLAPILTHIGNIVTGQLKASSDAGIEKVRLVQNGVEKIAAKTGKL